MLRVESEKEDSVERTASVNRKVTTWNPKDHALIPSSGFFRPLYFFTMVKTENGIDLDPKYHNLFFVTTVFEGEEDASFIKDSFIPYLQSVVEERGIDWDPKLKLLKDMIGVMVPGRLLSIVIQGMMSTRPPTPFIYNLMFLS